MNEDRTDFKQIITKKDLINLTSMINDKKKNNINQYINKILALDDTIFQQELDKNHIETLEDAKRFLEEKISEIENQGLKKCSLHDLDMNHTYFHFTDIAYLEAIREKGLISNIGKHSEGIDEKPSIFFSLGMVATIQGIDVWIKWAMHRMYGEKNQFHIYDELDKIETKLRQSKWATEFINREYLNDDVKKERAFEFISDSLKGKTFLALDLRPGIDFSFDDIDYTKQRALISVENGNTIPYLFMKEMYGNYSDAENTRMDKWNMHTFFDAQVDPNRIRQITDSKGKTDMLHILIELYDKCSSKDCQLDILDDFISYAKRQISTQALNKQPIRAIEKPFSEDEYEPKI